MLKQWILSIWWFLDLLSQEQWENWESGGNNSLILVVYITVRCFVDRSLSLSRATKASNE